MAEEKKRNPLLDAILNEPDPASAAAVPVPPAAMPAKAPPTYEEIKASGEDIGAGTSFGNALANKLAFNQLDKVRPWVGSQVQGVNDWVNRLTGKDIPRLPEQTGDQVTADLARGKEQHPTATLAGDIAGSMVRSAPLMPFAGPLAATLGTGTAERAIDVERGRLKPEDAVIGTGIDAAIGGTASVAGKAASQLLPGRARDAISTLVPKAFKDAVPPGVTAIKPAAVRAGAPALDAAAQGSYSPVMTNVGKGIKDAAWAGGSAGTAAGLAGAPGWLTSLLGTAGAVGGGLAPLLQAGKDLVSNTARPAAREAIDMLSQNPTKALEYINNPSMLRSILYGAAPSVAQETLGPEAWRKGKRREPQT